MKLIISGNFVINGNYHGNIAQQPISIKDSTKVTIDGKAVISGNFMQPDPWRDPEMNENKGLYPHPCMQMYANVSLIRQFKRWRKNKW